MVVNIVHTLMMLYAYKNGLINVIILIQLTYITTYKLSKFTYVAILYVIHMYNGVTSLIAAFQRLQQYVVLYYDIYLEYCYNQNPL